MAYAVMQAGDASPSEEQLVEAFRACDRLTDADARQRARRAMRILARGLSLVEAQAVAAILTGLGAPAAAIDEDDLFPLPSPAKLKRAAAHPHHLDVYDALGRPTALSWDQVLVVAAGVVAEQESQRTTRARVLHGGRFSQVVVDVDYQTASVDQLVLELVVNAEPCRYRVVAREWTDLSPGATVQVGLSAQADRLHAFVHRVASHAAQAIHNCGVQAVLRGDGKLTAYASPRVFEDELLWLCWRNTPGSQET